MAKSNAWRYCLCGTRLRPDHEGELCEQCTRRAVALHTTPPPVPPHFWESQQFRDAFEAQHIGLVSRAYRKHPHHVALYGKHGITQEVVGEWLGLTQAQISRIENGPPIRHLDTLEHWARTLSIPRSLLWFRASPSERTGADSLHGPERGVRDPSQATSPASGRTGSSGIAVRWPSTYPQPPSVGHGGEGRQPVPFPVIPFADTDYLDAVRTHIWHVVELDNRFGGTHLAEFAVSFFRSLHRQFGDGAYELSIERDLQAVIGELAELAGWLLYDAARQGEVRRMNQEALYFSRLSGDRQMELLTLQNCSMHAGFLGRPREALRLAESVLQGPDPLSPRIETLFLIRKARALAQGGDDRAMQLFETTVPSTRTASATTIRNGPGGSTKVSWRGRRAWLCPTSAPQQLPFRSSSAPCTQRRGTAVAIAT